MSSTAINVLRIVNGTTVDGPHFRTSIYLAGCTHHCPGCHNPQSWNEHGGAPMTVDEIMRQVKVNAMPVTLTGGDPLMNPRRIAPLLNRLKEEGFNVWLYTGYHYEELMNDPERRPLVGLVDVLVDGPFIMARRDTRLLFRGSSNQRLIDIRQTLLSGEITFWIETF